LASRLVTDLSLLVAAILVAVAALHGEGYPYVAGTLQESELTGFLKQILPPLYLYPSALMILLALAVLVTLKRSAAQAPVLGLVGVFVDASAILVFVLRGLTPGGVPLLVAALFALALLKARESSLGRAADQSLRLTRNVCHASRYAKPRASHVRVAECWLCMFKI